MTVRGEEDTPFASAVRRATLLTVSGIVPADLERQIRAGHRPRPDYVELANAMDAEILDVAAARRQAGVVGRFVAWFGVGPLLAWVCFRQRRRYSAIVTDGEQVGLPLALLLMTTRRRSCAHVMIAHILSTPKKVPLFRLLRLGRSIDRILVYASWQRRFVHEQLGYPEEQVILTSFMVDTRYFDGSAHDAPPERMICTAGLERRDYATLLEAVRDLDVKVVIGAASPWSKQGDSTEGRPLPENVEVRRLDFVELRDVYARSMFVVVPLHDVEFQAGVTTILEAMAMGKAVICSRTVGQTDVVVDEQTGVYVTPGDAAELRAAIKRLLDDPDRARSLGAAARAYVERECDVTTYARRLARIVAEARTRMGLEECAACQPSA